MTIDELAEAINNSDERNDVYVQIDSGSVSISQIINSAHAFINDKGFQVSDEDGLSEIFLKNISRVKKSNEDRNTFVLETSGDAYCTLSIRNSLYIM